ncbi:glycosyltransferase family 4 protein [Dictyobacter kobayashii]|uniref:Glycosyltransferase WbuB n=1 Tax=Dictyobacter kobayashii TaxID=2014872 RepID=A0A402APL7_9CHLR|nr:glycosyltransferase family 4 protein [Dictyobacter kobayashii]GCE20965.1 glycosyltransferase WbuB [Dictyobacter kobayashii]
MTHILIVSRYYPPEIAVTGVCLSEVAKRLVALGHQVTVLTTVPSYPTGVVPAEYRGHLIQNEERDGVRIIRTWSYAAANRGFFKRVLAQFSFGCLAPILGWRAVGRPSVVIVSSPPLFNVIAGRLLAWLKHAPLILRVADLWPESAVQLGMLKNPLLIRLAEWLEWSTYQQASFVWVVTEGIRNRLLQRGLPLEKICLLTNGVDTSTFAPTSQAAARAELGWDDRFTVLYAGGHGISHGLTNVLDAAEQLQSDTQIRLVLVGDGAEKSRLVAEAERRQLTNVTFLAALPHHDMPRLLAAADACLVHVRKVPLFQGMLPVKMYEAMACARPILLAVDGEARQLAAQEAGAALYVEPENPAALAAAIRQLRDSPALAKTLGERGRELVERRFDYDQLVQTLNGRIAMLPDHKLRRPLSASKAANVSSDRGDR